MSAHCGPDRLGVPALALGAQPPPAQLKAWLDAHRIDWRKEAPTRTPSPPDEVDAHDAWLVGAWDGFVKHLLQCIPGYFVISSGKSALPVPPATVPERFIGLGKGKLLERPGSVSRSAMGSYLLRYYWPYTDAKALHPWLPQLVTNASGFRSAGIGEFSFPEGVHNLESFNDRQALDRLESSLRPALFDHLKAPQLEPRAPDVPVPQPGTELSARFRERQRHFDERQRIYRRDFDRFDAARKQWEQERARAESLIRDPRVNLAQQRQHHKPPAVRGVSVLGISLDTGALPSNLFISQIAPLVEPYLSPIRQIERTFGSAFVAQPIVAWFYFLIGMGLIPNWRHWRLHWGTAVIEDLLPAQLDALAVTRRWVERQLVDIITDAANEARRRDDTPSPVTLEFRSAEQRILQAVREVSLGYLDQVRANHLAQLKFAVEEQGGGRIRLDPETFTQGRPWRLRVNRSGMESLDLSYPEQVAYAPGLDQDVRWMLRAVWPQVRSVTALCNQASVQLRINAANNRWGGKHPPHSSHKQGCDIDWDMGMRGEWVPNLVQREGKTKRPFSRFFRNEPIEGGDQGPPCQIGIDRLVMWIGIQANLIAGVRALLYGDEPLLDDATRHLTSRFSVQRPARSSADPEPRSHHNHLHADYLPHAVQNCIEPLVWAVRDTDDLSARLHALALQRDADPGFWFKLAGLEQVPTSAADFLTLRRVYRSIPGPQIERQIRAWQFWWNQRAVSGIPLLPVWNPALALETRDALVCGVGRMTPEGVVI